MSLKINNRELSDEEVLAQFKKRTAEYRKWRMQKAAEFLQNKKRAKHYHCYTIETETSVEDEYYIALSDDIIARVRALKEEINNNPELKTDEDRADEFSDRVCEIGYDIQNVPQPWPDDNIFTNIDLDDYLYYYRFDIHFFGEKENKNGQRLHASASLTDEEYIELLAHLIDQPHCSFHHLAYLSPKLKAIHKKVDEDLHDIDFGVSDYFCHDHDYAVLMTELRDDANLLLKQLKKKKEEYPHLNFLKDPVVNFAKVSIEHSAKKSK